MAEVGSHHSTRQTVVRALKSLDAHPIENPMKKGTPDVNCTLGWIELKYLKRWPPRGGIVRLPHYTDEQRTWARRRRLCGGKCWLLLQVREDWMLFDGIVAANHIGQSTKEVLALHALQYWAGNFTEQSLLEHIKLHGRA